MSEFQVSLQELQAQMEQLRQHNQQLKSYESELAEYASGLKSMWEGDAANAYIQAISKDCAHIGQFASVIGLFIAVMQTIISNYLNAENENISLAGCRSHAV